MRTEGQDDVTVPRFDAEWIDQMLRHERRGSPPAETVLDLIGLADNAVIADIGCGPGFLTIPAAKRVYPAGRVYAVDVELTMLDLVAGAAEEQGLGNVETRRSSGSRIPLDNALADVTFCALVLHYLDDPSQMVRELHRITRLHGRIAIVEWTPFEGDPRRNRIPPETIARLLLTVGREPGPVIALSDRQYLIVGT
jgi:ubiquinone/menaquinone biosynthesis C-methylase UbiE